MNMAANVPVVVTPHLIEQNLESVAHLVEQEDFNVQLVQRMLRRAAANVKLIFELGTDPETGEFTLKNYGQAWMLADLLYAGKLVPSSYTEPAQVVVALMKCTEIKVSPITGLANMMVVNNRVSVWGDLAQALVERSGQVAKQLKEEVGEKPAPGLELKEWSPDYGWRVSTWRKGQDEPYVGTYTVADAKRANLWMNSKKLPWITDPGQMLFNRARSRSLRDGFADCLLGMGIIEEQADFTTITATALDKTSANAALDDEPVTESDQLPDHSERPDPTQPASEAVEQPSLV